MALEPPRVGPQQIEQEAKPRLSARERLGSLNQHFLIVLRFSQELTQLVQATAITGQGAIKDVNVDGEPRMTQEQFEGLSESLTEMVHKVMDLSEHVRQILVSMSQIAGRPLPRMGPGWSVPNSSPFQPTSQPTSNKE